MRIFFVFAALVAGNSASAAVNKKELLEQAAAGKEIQLESMNSILNQRDLAEIRAQTKVSMEVNSNQFNRRDLQAMQEAGVELNVHTFFQTLTASDYLALAESGPIGLRVNSPILSKDQLMELAKNQNVRLQIEPVSSGMTQAEITQIMAVAAKARELEEPASTVIQE